jgi:4-amino-4-deoxy-L-arabinose transferase-like glycosyltransferase
MAVVRAPRQTYFAEQSTWLVERAAGSHWRAGLLLVVVALLAFLPGFLNIPPVDRDEARFAQATKQMLESGDYIDIRFQDESRYKKPVGIYWLQAATVRAAEAAGIPGARVRIFLYRLPSLAGAIGAVLLTYWAALGFVSRRAAVLAGIMMATSILLGVEARLAKTDAMLLLTVIGALGALGRVYLNERGVRRDDSHPWTNPAIFWTAIAAGVLLKGPLILLFVGLTGLVLVVLDRSATWLWKLKPVAGIPWMLLLVLPWFAAIVIRSGDTFFIDSIGKDLLAKVGSGQESHGLPPGFYIALFWVTFFPGSMLAGLATPAVWRARAEPGAKFLLAWLVPAWILFELVPTKLPHYVLPLYPAIAILIAGVVDNHALSRARWL